MKERITKETEITNFKGILLYIDEAQKESSLKKYNSNIIKNNEFILEAESLLNRKLTKKEIASVLKNPVQFAEYIKTQIRGTFQFTNATESFNLSALGISFDKLNSLCNIQNDGYKYLADGGKVTAEPKQLKSIKDSCKVYTRNERQNKVYKVAKNIKDSADELIKLGITFSSTQHNFGRATNQLVLNDTSQTLKINYRKILSL